MSVRHIIRSDRQCVECKYGYNAAFLLINDQFLACVDSVIKLLWPPIDRFECDGSNLDDFDVQNVAFAANRWDARLIEWPIISVLFDAPYLLHLSDHMLSTL